VREGGQAGAGGGVILGRGLPRLLVTYRTEADQGCRALGEKVSMGAEAQHESPLLPSLPVEPLHSLCPHPPLVVAAPQLCFPSFIHSSLE
jgi:hypothetical protein